MKKSHLFIGFGDLASRCAQELVAKGAQVVGIARSEKYKSDNIELWQGDVKSAAILQKIISRKWASATIILSPDTYTETAYRQCYFDSVKALCEAWKNSANKPGKIIFISSSSVYAQSQGEWVDENSEAQPDSPTAKILKQTEALLLNQYQQAIILRFSGIYGPGRDYLIRQVRAGNGGGENYTNRIHVDDCVNAILYLLDNAMSERIYLASDRSPVKSYEIRSWLAAQMGMDPALLVRDESAGRGGNKRCRSDRLISSGFSFCYPNYQQGYAAMLGDKDC